MSKIAIIVSEFNKNITNALLDSIIVSVKHKKLKKPSIYKVPGAIELIFASKQLILLNKFDAIIILGCVIKGKTDHYTYVCQQVSNGMQTLIINYDTPIVFGVLTTNNVEEAIERSDSNQLNYGKYYLNTALSLINLKNNIFKSHLK